jgi:hypothetical protein
MSTSGAVDIRGGVDHCGEATRNSAGLSAGGQIVVRCLDNRNLAVRHHTTAVTISGSTTSHLPDGVWTTGTHPALFAPCPGGLIAHPVPRGPTQKAPQGHQRSREELKFTNATSDSCHPPSVAPAERAGYVGPRVTGVGCGLSGRRRKVRRVLSDPAATVLVVDLRDRLACLGVEDLEAALSAAWWAAGGARAGRDGDRVRDMTEALTSECACARPCGEGAVRNRVVRVVVVATGEVR